MILVRLVWRYVLGVFLKKIVITLKVKVLTYSICLLTFSGIFSKTLIYKEALDIFVVLSLILSFCFLSFFVWSLITRKQLRKRWFAKTPKNKPILGICIIFIMTPLFMYLPIVKGIPTLVNFAPFDIDTQIVTVRENNRGKIWVLEFEGFANQSIRGLPRWALGSLHPGDRIKLTGKKSPIAFSYESFTILKNGRKGNF